MSDNHPDTCEQDARRESVTAGPTGGAHPLMLRLGPNGSWTRAVLKTASQRMARRPTDLAVLLVLGMTASEVLAQPPFGGPPPMPGPPMGELPFGGPPAGAMMGPPRFGPPTGMVVGGRPGPMSGGPARPSLGRAGGPAGPGIGRPTGGALGAAGRPRPGPIPRGAGGAPGFPANRPPLGFSPAALAAGRPTAGRPVPDGAGGGPAGLARVGAGGRTQPGRADNPRHASWYHGGWSNSRGGTWDNGRTSSAWDKARDYVREERARDYATGLAWGLGWGSSGYGSGDSTGSGYSSGYSGYGTGFSSGSGDAYASTSSDASSTDSDASRTDAAQEAKSDGQQDGAAAGQGDPMSNPGPDGTKTATDSAAAADRGYQAFDRARDAFKAGDYSAALDLTDAALKGVPDDPAVHDFKALALFARGDDSRAAAELHTVLAVTPGMDWTTLRGLYPDVETYTGQLRALEDRCGQDPKAAAPRFVLAYHYLVAGHKDAAVARLKAVLALEPGDQVARRLLASLTPTPRRPSRPGPDPTATAPPVAPRRRTSSAAGGASATGRRST